jgi:hypothetical protein
MLRNQQIFVVKVGAEESGVVGIDDNIEPRVHHAVDRMIGRSEITERGGEGGCRRADGEEDAVLPACGYERRIVDHMVAMIDAIAGEHIKGSADMLRRTILTRMGGHAQSPIPGVPVNVRIETGRMADLVVIEADADDFLPSVRQHEIEPGSGVSARRSRVRRRASRRRCRQA